MAQASQRRQQVFDFIRKSINERGYSPTVREIMDGCGINSVSSVQHHLNMLEKHEAIRRDPAISRSIQLVESGPGEDIIEVPLLGTIAAGEPIPVPDSDNWTMVAEEALKLPLDLLRGKHKVFALMVKGTSMIDALIADGDIVIMEPARTAENGASVAVWLKDEQEVTLKKIYQELGYIRLQPANPLMDPIITTPDNVEIQGKLIAVIRQSR